MRPDKYSRAIAEIISHSHAMVRYAEAGRWDTVAEEEIKRSHLIRDFFSTPSNITKVPNIEAAVNELLQINDKLEQLTAAARDEIGSALAALKTGRTAVSAYRENSR